MNKNTGILIGLGLLALVGIWWYVANQRMTPDPVRTQERALETTLKQGVETAKEKKDAVQGDLSAMLTLSTVLKAQNNSDQNGVMTVVDDQGKAKVILKIASGAKDVAQPAHLHVGACPTPGAIAYPLSSVVNGTSETTLAISTKELMNKLPLAVNVHKSAEDLKTYVSCGDVVKDTAEPE